MIAVEQARKVLQTLVKGREFVAIKIAEKNLAEAEKAAL